MKQIKIYSTLMAKPDGPYDYNWYGLPSNKDILISN